MFEDIDSLLEDSHGESDDIDDMLDNYLSESNDEDDEDDEALLAELEASDLDLSENMTLQNENLKEVESLLDKYLKTDETIMKVHTQIKKITYPFVYVESLSQLEYKYVMAPQVDFVTEECIDLYLKNDSAYRKVCSIPNCIDGLLRLTAYNPSKIIKVKLSKEVELDLDNYVNTLFLRRK